MITFLLFVVFIVCHEIFSKSVSTLLRNLFWSLNYLHVSIMIKSGKILKKLMITLSNKTKHWCVTKIDKMMNKILTTKVNILTLKTDKIKFCLF